MESIGLQMALGLGVLGWFGALLLSRHQAARQGIASPPSPMPVASHFAWAAGALPILIFLATLPEQAPWGRGQGFGRGFFLGGLLALLAAWSLMQTMTRAASQRSHLQRAAASTLALWLTLPAVALPLLLMRATIIDALCGVALGWLAVAIVLVVGAQDDEFQLKLAASVGFVITLCATAILGVYRDFRTPGMARGTWEALALCVAAGVPLLCLLSALLVAPLTRGERVPLSQLFGFVAGEDASARNAFATRAWQWLIATILLLIVGRVLSVKAIEEPRILGCIGIGLIVGPLAWLASREAMTRTTASSSAPLPLISPLGALVVLGGFMVSYGLLQGVGAGLMLLGAWPTAVIASSRSTHERDTATLPIVALHDAALCLQLLFFGAVLLVYRVVATRFRADLRGATLSDHYALLGFIVGASLPMLLSQLALPRREERWSLARLSLCALIMLAAPTFLMVLYGAKTVPAMIFGLALGCLLHFGSLIGPLLSVGVALLLQQWMHHLLPLAEMSRHERLRVLSFVVAAVVVALMAADVGARLLHRRQAVRPSSPL